MAPDIGHIVELLKARDFSRAEALCRQGLVDTPDNPELKMCLGICRLLQGDKETFRGIRDELAPRMGTLIRKKQVSKEVLALWRKYNKCVMEYVVLGTLALSAAVATAMVLGDSIKERFLYAGPGMPTKDWEATRTLYAGPEYFNPSEDNGHDFHAE